MAFCDDEEWLMSHIYNSFITSDDTGVCELVMTVESHAPSAGDDVDRDSYFRPHSPEIVMDMEMGGHRRRSNTSQRLEQLQKERRNAARSKQVVWQPAPATLSATELSSIFVKSPISPCTEPRASLLTEHLRNLHIADNPFSEFAKFDGRAHINVSTRRITIFLTMTPPEELAFPLCITVVASARVSDVVGLVCWQYTNENRLPRLSEAVDRYCLYLAEDDGEVDWDFPPLDERETVAKFGFNVLALVATELVQITIDVDEEIGRYDQVSLSLNKRTLSVTEVIHSALSHLSIDTATADSFDLKLTTASSSDPVINQNTDLLRLHALHFTLVHSGSRKKDVAAVEEPSFSGLMSAMEATVYQSFKVNLLSKLAIGAPVQLGISGDRVEIDPVHVGSALRVSKLLKKPRAVTHQMCRVVDCQMTDVKYGGRAVFRIVVLGSSEGGGYKQLDFESDVATAKDIVKKMRYILDFLASSNRSTYIQLKEKRGRLSALVK